MRQESAPAPQDPAVPAPADAAPKEEAAPKKEFEYLKKSTAPGRIFVFGTSEFSTEMLMGAADNDLFLQSIVDYERFNPAVSRDFDGAACGLGCSNLAKADCSCTAMTMHWSSTPVLDSEGRSLALGFNLGFIGDLDMRDQWSVRAVRNAEPATGAAAAPPQAQPAKP